MQKGIFFQSPLPLSKKPHPPPLKPDRYANTRTFHSHNKNPYLYVANHLYRNSTDNTWSIARSTSIQREKSKKQKKVRIEVKSQDAQMKRLTCKSEAAGRHGHPTVSYFWHP